MKRPSKRIKIVSLKLVKESSLLYKERSVRSPEDAFKLMKLFLEDKDREYFIVASLDTKNQPVSINVCHNWKPECQYSSSQGGNEILDKVASLARSDKLIRDVVIKINNGSSKKAAPLLKEFETLKKSLSSIQSKRDKVFGLYEDGLIEKGELSERLDKLNEEKRLMEDRLTPLELELGNGIQKEVTFGMVSEIMKNFVSSYKKCITTEQKKQLLNLLIKQITIGEDREIESIQLQLNNEVVRHFSRKGEEESSDDDFSSPFYICFAI